ncbi:MAG TPA: nitronate monooxygenase [Bacteroidales bacterium]|nr:nitronate monooxygenase [Bacteroidales bacterium]
MEELIIGDCRAKLPIIQGGMGVGISLSRLAAAVANAGGIGVISAAAIGMFEPDYMKNFRQANKRALRREIQQAKQMAPNGIIGVNIMVALTDHEELIKVAIEEEADLVIIGAGLPLKIPAMLEEAGFKDFRTKLVIKVSSAKAAKLIFQSWSSRYNRIPDAVVVEGPMAGGHLGFKKEELGENLVPLDQLIRETVKEVAVFEQTFAKEVPVIAAGGIYTGEDMYSIMQAGAKAVKLGTRFVTTHECDASLAFKESYLACNKEDLTIINSPVGLPGRVVNSSFVEQIKAGNTKPFRCSWKCLSNCNYKEAPYCIALALFNAAQGRMDEGFAFAGSNAYKAQSIQHVSEVFEELITEYHNASIAHQTKETRELSLEIPFIRAVS